LFRICCEFSSRGGRSGFPVERRRGQNDRQGGYQGRGRGTYVNQRGFRGGGGGRFQHRGGRTQGMMTAQMPARMKFDDPFDFEKANEELQSQLQKLKIEGKGTFLDNLPSTI